MSDDGSNPTYTPNPAALSKLAGLGQEVVSGLINSAQRSPYLQGLIDNLANSNVTVTLGAIDHGTGVMGNQSATTLSFDPNMVPGGFFQVTPDQFAVLVAHELGHLEVPGGQGSNTANPFVDLPLNGQAEGIALVSEYVVAKQLNTPMVSDQGINLDPTNPLAQIPPGGLTQQLDKDASAAGVNVGALTFTPGAITSFDQAGSAAVKDATDYNLIFQTPSGYNLSYWDKDLAWSALAALGFEPSQVDWTKVYSDNITVMQTDGGGWGVYIEGVPTLNGYKGGVLPSDGALFDSNNKVIESTLPTAPSTQSFFQRLFSDIGGSTAPLPENPSGSGGDPFDFSTTAPNVSVVVNADKSIVVTKDTDDSSGNPEQLIGYINNGSAESSIFGTITQIDTIGAGQTTTQLTSFGPNATISTNSSTPSEAVISSYTAGTSPLTVTGAAGPLTFDGDSIVVPVTGGGSYSLTNGAISVSGGSLTSSDGNTVISPTGNFAVINDSGTYSTVAVNLTTGDNGLTNVLLPGSSTGLVFQTASDGTSAQVGTSTVVYGGTLYSFDSQPDTQVEVFSTPVTVGGVSYNTALLSG